MNWRHFLFLPAAALAVGTSASAPRLSPEIPAFINQSCDYQLALRDFYFAYAYASENPRKTAGLCAEAREKSGACGEEAKVLKERVNALCQIQLFKQEAASIHSLDL